MVLTTVIISRGGQDSLRLARERLGADVVVVPRGSVTGVEGALLLGNATNTYMPRGVVDAVSAVPGVAQASSQLYLTSMANSSCCSVSTMFMFAFDPVTDFTVEPWLKEKLGHDLQTGQAVGGARTCSCRTARTRSSSTATTSTWSATWSARAPTSTRRCS